MKEYKLHKAWMIVILVFCPLLILLFCWLPFNLSDDTPWTLKLDGLNWLLPVGCLAMIIVFIYGMIDAVKGKFVIERNAVYTVNPLGERQLLLQEIKGYKEDDKYIYIFPVSREQKRIKVSKYFQGSAEIVGWLDERYDNLDLVEQATEYKEIISNNEHGFTEEDREQKLASARSIAWKLNVAGAIIGAWAFFWPHPYELASATAILFPIGAAMILKSYKGLMRVELKDKSSYAKLNFAFLAPACGLVMVALTDYNILDSANLWLPALLLSGLLIYLAMIGPNLLSLQKPADYFSLVFILAFIFGYGYGSVAVINCVFDKSVAKTTKTTILKKWSRSGKTTSYHLQVEATEQPEGYLEVVVGRAFFSVVGEQGQVLLDYRKGLLNAPWVDIRTSDGVRLPIR